MKGPTRLHLTPSHQSNENQPIYDLQQFIDSPRFDRFTIEVKLADKHANNSITYIKNMKRCLGFDESNMTFGKYLSLIQQNDKPWVLPFEKGLQDIIKSNPKMRRAMRHGICDQNFGIQRRDKQHCMVYRGIKPINYDSTGSPTHMLYEHVICGRYKNCSLAMEGAELRGLRGQSLSDEERLLYLAAMKYIHQYFKQLFTSKEIEVFPYILHPKMTTTKIADQLGKSYEAIKTRRRKIGDKGKECFSPAYTHAEEIALLLHSWDFIKPIELEAS